MSILLPALASATKIIWSAEHSLVVSIVTISFALPADIDTIFGDYKPCAKRVKRFWLHIFVAFFFSTVRKDVRWMIINTILAPHHFHHIRP